MRRIAYTDRGQACTAALSPLLLPDALGQNYLQYCFDHDPYTNIAYKAHLLMNGHLTQSAHQCPSCGGAYFYTMVGRSRQREHKIIYFSQTTTRSCLVSVGLMSFMIACMGTTIGTSDIERPDSLYGLIFLLLFCTATCTGWLMWRLSLRKTQPITLYLCQNCALLVSLPVTTTWPRTTAEVLIFAPENIGSVEKVKRAMIDEKREN
jgi:hypothetical protein